MALFVASGALLLNATMESLEKPLQTIDQLKYSL